ncbi:MAG: hypothetical protein AAFR11_09235 [Pseudomonadota bacterium]
MLVALRPPGFKGALQPFFQRRIRELREFLSFDFHRREARISAQALAVCFGEIAPLLMIDNAERSDGGVFNTDRRARVKPHVRRAQHQRIVLEPRIPVRIEDDEFVDLKDRMGAERFIASGACGVKADRPEKR